MKETWIIFFIFSTSLLSVTIAKKKVCIIGGGPAGIVSVKHLADHINEFEPIAFERNSDVGGLWIYTDSTTVDIHGLPVHSSVYKNLRTSNPKEMMSCPDYQKFDGEPRSCVKHETVVDYIKNYTDHFNLRPYVKFDTNVEKVTPVPNPRNQRYPYWDVETRDLNTNATQTTRCDAVVICTGQFYSPMIPKIKGIESFPGKVFHSHLYRKPEEFKDQTVTILGAAVSGFDIAFELSRHVKTIYLSHRHDKIEGDFPANIIQVPGVVAAEGRNLILSNGSKIEADTFIYCTGYKNELPFLDESSGIEVNPKYLYPLYNQVININNPTMGFVGLVPGLKAFCPKFYSQANYFVSFLRNHFELPSHAEMMKNADLFLPENLKKANVNDRWYWNYIYGLAYTGGFTPLPYYYREGLTKWANFRNRNLRHFKEYDLELRYNSYAEIVQPNGS